MAERTLLLITEPAVEPVSLTEAKAHCVVEHSTDDAMLTMMIKAARRHTEARTHRGLVYQKWRAYFDGFCPVLDLNKYPLISVVSVNYKDENGDTQTVGAAASPNNASDYYTVDVPKCAVRLAYGASWPNTYPEANAVWVDFYVGLANTATSPQGTVPEDLKVAILLLVGDLYEHREKQSEIELYKNPAYDLLISPYWMPLG